jgi:hypothetical protein
MRIPKSIIILGIKYKVVRVDMTKREEWGYAHPDKRLIEVAKQTDEVLPEVLEQAFFHECMHMAFHGMGEEELFSNERVVDVLANVFQEVFNQLEGK